MKLIEQNSYDFELIRRNGAIYVDKTAYLHALIVSPVARLYFLSRPRRFGKSLMLSTLKCIFEGRKDLFEGLAISKMDYDWKTYPVLHLDMASITAGSIAAMQRKLVGKVRNLAAQLKLDAVPDEDPAVAFDNLWEAIGTAGLSVVVLVDEYDVPLQGYLNDPAAFETVRKMMHDFYVRLKTYSGNIRFLMMTGVTKLTKLSIFSGLNNPTDITMDADYAGLLGYTHDELKAYFAEHIAAFAKKADTTDEAIFAKLLEWYDNYRFSPDSDVRVLNPVSVGSALAKRKFARYWISTGKATLVIERLKKAGRIPSDLDSLTAFEDELDVCDAMTMPLKSLLYQGGYLTIKSVSEDGEISLGVPNAEVRSALVYDYLDTEIPEGATSLRSAQLQAARFLREGKLDEAIQMFRVAVAGLPYEWLESGKEGAAKTAFALFFYAMNDARVTYERQSIDGRLDAVVDFPDRVYIFEFKYDHSAQEAYDQILKKGYHVPYMASGKPITGIGLNFSPAAGSRGIDPAVIGEIS